jgi:hypothetical protein
VSRYRRIVLATPNLTHYWPLDEPGPSAVANQYKDLVGGIHGTAANVAVLNGQRGLLRNDPSPSVYLNGGGTSRITFQNFYLPSTGFSIELWSRPSSASALMGAWNTAGAMLYIAGSTDLRLYCAGSGAFVSATVANLFDGSVKYIVGTCDGTTGRVYLNGVQVASGSLGINNSGLYWESGSYNNGSGGFITTYISHIATYGRALTAAEVLSHYNAGR